MNDNMGGRYPVTAAIMRGTLRMARGEATRRQLRQRMFELGYGEPFVSGYLDMVQRALRQLKDCPR